MDIFSNLMVIGECLLDTCRTNAFIRAIKKTVREGDIALDVGTGSGILAMTSARAGAKHVYAIDIASDIVAFAKTNIRNNHLGKRITVQQTDAKHFVRESSVDVVTMELMDTWLVAEHQGVVMNALHKNGTIGKKTRLIPYRYQCALTLADYDFSFYGNRMPFVIQARNFAVTKRIIDKRSKRIIVNDIDFAKPVNTQIDSTVTIPIKENGRCNALVLESKTFLAPGIAVWGTTDMNMPVIVPIEEVDVVKGQQISIRIRCTMGQGFNNFNVLVEA